MADLCERQRTKLPAPRPPTKGGLLPVIPLPNICLVLRTYAQTIGTPTGWHENRSFSGRAWAAAGTRFSPPRAWQSQSLHLAKPELAAEGAALRPPPFGISAAD